MIARSVADDAKLWELFAAAAADPAAWPALLAELEPDVVALARFQPIGRLRQNDDSPREIATRVFERLHADNRATIKRLCARDPRPDLRAWLRVVVRRTAIDYMRGHAEYQRATTTRPNAWITLASLTSSAPGNPDSREEKRRLVLTTVHDMVARAATELAEHGDDAFGRLALEWKLARIHIRRLATRGSQLEAVLVGLIEGRTQSELAESLGVTRREIELTVRYLEELLLARFHES
jgi:DNA-directed RNA polymerase specialized sigma24 family protein